MIGLFKKKDPVERLNTMNELLERILSLEEDVWKLKYPDGLVQKDIELFGSSVVYRPNPYIKYILTRYDPFISSMLGYKIKQDNHKTYIQLVFCRNKSEMRHVYVVGESEAIEIETNINFDEAELKEATFNI